MGWIGISLDGPVGTSLGGPAGTSDCPTGTGPKTESCIEGGGTC